jgi:hypothetical protein
MLNLGTAALGTIVNLTAVGNLHVDIVVVASVVVNPITGARLGNETYEKQNCFVYIDV